MKYDFDKIISRRGTGSSKWDQRSEDILPMWVADMDFQSPPAVIEALKKRAEHGIYGYPLPMDSYYDAIIHWVGRRHGWKIERDWIMFSPGVVPGISAIIRSITKPGDKVILQRPVYYPFFADIEHNGRHILNNPLKYVNGHYEMDFPDLEQKAKDPRAKALILCSPHNPVGRVWSKEELTRLGEICVNNNIIIISDEIHCDLIYKGYTHTCFASINETFLQNSITCFAPSKTFNLAGLQTSAIIIPNPKMRQEYDNMIVKARVIPSAPNIFGAIALEAAYNHGDDWLEQLMDYVAGNLAFLKKWVETRIPRIKVVEPEGTYLVWLDCRDLGMDANSLERFMLEKAKVWFDEGYIFGPEGEGFERINIACPRAILEEGLKRLENAINRL